MAGWTIIIDESDTAIMSVEGLHLTDCVFVIIGEDYQNTTIKFESHEALRQFYYRISNYLAEHDSHS